MAFRAAPIVDGGLFHLDAELRPLFLKAGIALADRSDAAFTDAQNALQDAVDASLDYHRGPGA